MEKDSLHGARGATARQKMIHGGQTARQTVPPDSGSILSVNNVEVINGGPADVGWWRSGRIVLNAGTYPFSVLDLELDQWRGVTVEYEGPRLERQTIPQRFLLRR